MHCTKCENEAILYQDYSGQHLCLKHFAADVEAKARKAIRQHHWLRSGDHIGVPLSCDPKTGALLMFLADLVKTRPDIRLTAIFPTCAGNGMADPGAARTLAGSLGIPGFDCPCREPGSPCPVMQTAREKGVTRLASGAGLEETAYTALRYILDGNIECILQDQPGETPILPVITPFLTIPVEEILLYAGIRGIEGNYTPDASGDSFQNDVDALLGRFTCNHPATPYAVVNLITTIAPDVIASGSLVRDRLCRHCTCYPNDG